MDILVAILSAVAGLFIYQALGKKSADRGQIELETKVTQLEDKTKDLEAGIAKNEKETQGKVDEITKEQSKPLDSKQLAEWFSRRK